MKKLLILLLMLLLVACGTAAPPDVETETGGVEQGAVSDTAGYNANEEAAAETPETAVPLAETPAVAGDAIISPATTPAEAAQVRPQDWAIGADDPLVTIIEYGDFQ